MIDQLTIDRVKAAANVVDVIGDFYTLKKDGVNMTCLCPFHEDRHLGSFKVSESKNVFTCYSCGKHGNAVDFLELHEHLSFIEAIKWLGAKYGIDVEGSDTYKEKVKECKPHAPVPPLPMLDMPVDWVKATRQRLADNTFIKWLYSLRWSEEQHNRIDKMLKNYQVGASKQGHTIFWQIDENGKIRTGKMMLYKPNGHRDKESQHNFDYIHSVMYRNQRLDPMNSEAVTCYFGQHLIDACPNATINIVESEKTALICAIAYGNIRKQLWIATGGLNFLNAEKLKPFIDRGRNIVLYPDHDGIDAWRDKADQIDYKHLSVNSDLITKWWNKKDGPKADIADIIIRLLNPKSEEMERLCELMPNLKYLSEKLDLEIESINTNYHAG